jgi:DNA-binding transcriptional ArsR family regulator
VVIAMDDKSLILFKALADHTRQEILNLLGEQEQNVNEICSMFENMTQPTISHHLQILKRCKLVSANKKGKMVYYSINRRVLRNEFEDFIAKFDIDMI